jgi:isoquinoline 1-oxidoreductase subunit beta
MIPGFTLTVEADRRQVLLGGSALVALMFGFRSIGSAAAQDAPKVVTDPNVFIKVASDNSVTVMVKHLEMGQGVSTGLATLVAEEMDADWSQMRAVHAPADATKYNNLFFGPFQATGGSTSMANSWDQYRQAGAGARQMFVQGAAALWSVPAAEIMVDRGWVKHEKSGKAAPFGQLLEAAAKITPPDKVALKTPDQFKLIGKVAPRLDSAAKSTGKEQYTLDVALPGMLTALVLRSPRFGGTVATLDATAAKAVKGVVDVIQIPQGVAVLAQGMWAAKQGREALTVTWDDSKADKSTSADLIADYKARLETPGLPAKVQGNAIGALASAAKIIEGVFEFPYLAHAPMEPLDCVMRFDGTTCEIWSGAQMPTGDQFAAAGILGIKPEQVIVNTLSAGGSFGRRAQPNAELVVETAMIVKAIGGKAPVKLVRTREDDIQGGYYRPLYVHKVRAGIDAEGKLIAWQQRVAGQSIMAGTAFEKMMVKDGVDGTSVEGASNQPYAIANFTLDLHTTSTKIPVLWWRSVGSTHTAFVGETIMDELAEAAGQDPVAYREALLTDKPRHLAVLKLVAEKSDWGKALPDGVARGIAVHESFNSVVAQVAEIRLTKDGKIKVERVVCAVECGTAINPDIVKSQMEGGIGFGIGAALHDAITLKDGLVEQSNFHDYQPLRIDEMPKVEVYIVPSDAAPTGVGEPGVPVVAPAIANAAYKLTGKRIRALPFDQHTLTRAS